MNVPNSTPIAESVRLARTGHGPSIEALKTVTNQVRKGLILGAPVLDELYLYWMERGDFSLALSCCARSVLLTRNSLTTAFCNEYVLMRNYDLAQILRKRGEEDHAKLFAERFAQAVVRMLRAGGDPKFRRYGLVYLIHTDVLLSDLEGLQGFEQWRTHARNDTGVLIKEFPKADRLPFVRALVDNGFARNISCAASSVKIRSEIKLIEPTEFRTQTGVDGFDPDEGSSNNPRIPNAWMGGAARMSRSCR